MRFSTALCGLAAAGSSLGYPWMAKAPATTSHAARGTQAEDKDGVFFMNRIGPSSTVLYIADADGSNTRQLLTNGSTASWMDYHAHWSSNGEWILFTSERNADGNSDIFRVRPNGTDLEELLSSPSVEDNAVLSPDGTKIAYVSTANGYKANVWVKDLQTGSAWNITNTTSTRGSNASPDGHFRPAWSPDGEWLAFSSDRNTAWTGHSNGTGWEHTQTLGIYVIRPNGTDFRKIVSTPGYCLGSPAWSPDGKRLAFYNMTREMTYTARSSYGGSETLSQIVSVDVETGSDVVTETSGVGLKMFPQYMPNGGIAYGIKSGDLNVYGLNYTQWNGTLINGTTAVEIDSVRSPSWSPDGKQVVYEISSFTAREQEKPLQSWQDDWEYRFTDVFPQLSYQGKMAYTQKQTAYANSSVVVSNPDGTGLYTVFDTYTDSGLEASVVASGTAGCFNPNWSPDGEWITFGVGFWFADRTTMTATIYRSTANGSYHEALTDGTVNSGFPSYSADGRYIAFRQWGGPYTLSIIDLQHPNKTARVLINATIDNYANLPMWSPDGSKILFSHRTTYTNFDVCTIKPDGSDYKCLTTSGANEAHAVWSHDGRIMYSSGMNGFQDEAAIYDDTFQQYGQVIIMNDDGSNKTVVTDSIWEDSMPLYVPNMYMGGGNSTT